MFFARPMKNQDFRFEWHKLRERGGVVKQEDFSNCNIKKLPSALLKYYALNITSLHHDHQILLDFLRTFEADIGYF